MVDRARIHQDIDDERDRQDEKWGADRRLHDGIWSRILGEEAGEVDRASLEREFPDGSKTPIEALLDQRAELVQVAATAIAWIEGFQARPDRSRIHKDIDDQRERQIEEWGADGDTLATEGFWSRFLGSALGSVDLLSIVRQYPSGSKTSLDALLDLRQALVDVAATAVAWIENLDKIQEKYHARNAPDNDSD